MAAGALGEAAHAQDESAQNQIAPEALSGVVAVDASVYNVDITVGSQPSLSIAGEHTRVRVDGDVLKVYRERGATAGWWRWWGSSDTAGAVNLTLPVLERVDASAGADVNVRGLEGGDVVARASSGADLVMRGACTRLEARVSSGADVVAHDLICEDVDASASSGGDLSVHATRTLTARASSGADVVAHGGAEVLDIEESSGGDVRLRRAN